jgi:hypothetical protein
MTDVYDKITELLPNFDEVGRGYIHTHCVFHDDRQKSLLIYPDARGYNPGYVCLSGECGKRGSLQELLRVIEGAPPRHRGDSEKEKPPYLPTDLHRLKNLSLKAHADLIDAEHPERRHYLTQRGVVDMIVPARLGWYKGWILTPVFKQDNSICGLYARATPPEQKRTGQRFTQPLGQRPMLYVPSWPKLLSSSNVVVVFGMMDALTLSLLSYPVVTTTGGSRAFDPSWLDQFRKPITIIPDESGDTQAAFDLAKGLGWRAEVLFLDYDDEVNDPADYAQYGRLDELKEALDE